MNNNRILKNFSILSLLIIYIVVYRLFVVKYFLPYAEFITGTFLMLMAFLGIIFYGYRKDKITPLKKQIYIITILQIVIFFTLSYGLGLVVGYLKNAYSLAPLSILNNIFAPIVIIVATEILRYVFLNGNSTRKTSIIMLTMVLVVFEISLSAGLNNVNDLESLFKFLTAVILPITIKNSVLSYLTLCVGYKPALMYRLVIDLYIMVLPVIPNFGEYITSMIGILFPFFLYLYSARSINEHYNGIEYEVQKSIFKPIDIPVILFIVVLVALVSGVFPYYFIGIGSQSMMPKINKGDAVIIHKIENKNKLKKGTIVVFKHKGRQTVHRLVKIEKIGKKTYYRTKGDANPTIDNINLEYKDIKGTVLLKIPAIAYPSIYFNEEIK